MILEWLEARRVGREQSEEDIAGFVNGVVDESITRAQAAAWLAFVYCKGMSDREIVYLTRAMTESGDKMTWPESGGKIIDKHSTGGVGDKVSLILAPLWAELGYRVPMISGRGLGITGGTLDKLESIQGYRTDLTDVELRSQLASIGCFISGQTSSLAPADKFLYALRNETATVPSIALITGSILSKKLAEGVEELVLDVKCGSGAFMKTRTEARSLANSLTRVGNLAGVITKAHITDMFEPLGCAVGNALEVEESIACLKGQGPKRLVDLIVELSGDGERAREVLLSGRAYDRFERMVTAQGGDLSKPLLGSGCERIVVRAEKAGTVRCCDAESIGRAAFVLGGGRSKAVDPIHHGVGVLVHAHCNDDVEVGDPLVTVVHSEKGLNEALQYVGAAFELEDR